MPSGRVSLWQRAKEVPELIALCLAGVTVGVVGPLLCWHYLTLTREGTVGPSIRPYSDSSDNPTITYGAGLLGCLLVGLISVVMLYAYLRIPPSAETPEQ